MGASDLLKAITSLVLLVLALLLLRILLGPLLFESCCAALVVSLSLHLYASSLAIDFGVQADFQSICAVIDFPFQHWIKGSLVIAMRYVGGIQSIHEVHLVVRLLLSSSSRSTSVATTCGWMYAIFLVVQMAMIPLLVCDPFG